MEYKFLVTVDLKNENSIIDRENNTYLYEITNTDNDSELYSSDEGADGIETMSVSAAVGTSYIGSSTALENGHIPYVNDKPFTNATNSTIDYTNKPVVLRTFVNGFNLYKKAQLENWLSEAITLVAKVNTSKGYKLNIALLEHKKSFVVFVAPHLGFEFDYSPDSSDSTVLKENYRYAYSNAVDYNRLNMSPPIRRGAYL